MSALERAAALAAALLLVIFVTIVVFRLGRPASVGAPPDAATPQAAAPACDPLEDRAFLEQLEALLATAHTDSAAVSTAAGEVDALTPTPCTGEIHTAAQLALAARAAMNGDAVATADGDAAVGLARALAAAFASDPNVLPAVFTLAANGSAGAVPDDWDNVELVGLATHLISTPPGWQASRQADAAATTFLDDPAGVLRIAVAAPPAAAPAADWPAEFAAMQAAYRAFYDPDPGVPLPAVTLARKGANRVFLTGAPGAGPRRGVVRTADGLLAAVVVDGDATALGPEAQQTVLAVLGSVRTR